MLSLVWVFRSGVMDLSQTTSNLYEHPFAVSNAANRTLANFYKLRSLTVELIVLDLPPEEIDERKNTDEKIHSEIITSLTLIERQFLGDLERVRRLAILNDEWKTVRHQMQTLVKERRISEANHLVLTKGTPLFKDVIGEATYIRDFAIDKASFLANAAKETQSSLLEKLNFLSGAAFLVLLILFGYVGSKTKRILELVDTANKRLQKEQELRHSMVESEKIRLDSLVAERTAQLEKALDMAKAASQSKSLFLGKMSHEMRTPLHQISGLAAMFRNEVLTEKQVRRLGLLNDATNRLETLVQSILTLVDLESKTTQVKYKPVNLQDIVNSVQSMLSEKAMAKGLNIVQQVDSFTSALMGDQRHLISILSCFTNNAITHSERGIITIRVTKVSEDTGEMIVKLAVEDQGSGISEENMARIFDHFEQADNSHTRKFGGAGVGLAIVKKLTELMGGDAGCESTVGVGSLFWATVKMPKYAAEMESITTDDYKI